jgi:hypothetical protein
MTTTVSAYLDDVDGAFLLSPVVRSVQVREREERLQEGFIRLRATLSNGDLLEAFEFVVATSNALQTRTYRIHWQHGDGQLKRRWDNAPHHKEVPTLCLFSHADVTEVCHLTTRRMPATGYRRRSAIRGSWEPHGTWQARGTAVAQARLAVLDLDDPPALADGGRQVCPGQPQGEPDGKA